MHNNAQDIYVVFSLFKMLHVHYLGCYLCNTPTQQASIITPLFLDAEAERVACFRLPSEFLEVVRFEIEMSQMTGYPDIYGFESGQYL